MIIGITSSGMGSKMFWIVVGLSVSLNRLSQESVPINN